MHSSNVFNISGQGQALYSSKCLGDTSAGFVGQAFNFWNVCGTLLLNLLARLSIPGMSVARFC